MSIIFLDTETTSLDRRTREIWEIGWIKRTSNEDLERHMFIEVDLEFADIASLRIGDYFRRHPDPYRKRIPEQFNGTGAISAGQAAKRIAEEFQGATIVGAVPSFDEESMAGLLYRAGMTPTWHYHLVDIESMAAGRLQVKPPWNFNTLLSAFGLEYTETERHTALGDARMVRDLYDAVMGHREKS